MASVRVGVDWVEHFHGDDCNQGNLDYTADQAEGFLNSMSDHGHERVFDWGDDLAWETDIRDPANGGHSDLWADNVHFFFFDSHGGNWDNVLHLSFPTHKQNCMCDSTQWRLGDKSLKWITFAGCETVLTTDAGHVLAVWGPPTWGVHLVMGYVGDSHDSWWTNDLGGDFADDICGGDAIGPSWCDRAYSFWLGETSIAIAVGETQADAVNRRDNETLDWRDIGIGSSNWLAWHWRG